MTSPWRRRSWPISTFVILWSEAVAGVASPADLVEVASSADPAGMTIGWTILTMMIRVILIVTLMCVALLSRMFMSYEYHDLHGPDDGGVYCVSRGDAGGAPYWTGDKEGDFYEGDVTLPWADSDEPVNCVVHTSEPVGPGGPCDEAGDVCEGEVSLPQTGSDEPVISVVSASGLGGPGGYCYEECDVYEGHVALHQTGSDETVHNVVSAIGPGGPGDETGSVADVPGDAIVMSSECWEIYEGTLDNIRMWRANPQS